MIKLIKCFILDLDGTLLNTLEPIGYKVSCVLKKAENGADAAVNVYAEILKAVRE